jgi:hypothetical protein
MSLADLSRFEHLSFDGFRRLAADPTLSPAEKIGFPDAYRAGKEPAIFADILAKLPGLRRRGATVLDVGPGCSELAFLLIDHCRDHDQTLVQIDSAEMLALLPDPPHVRKFAARFPNCPELFGRYAGRCDAVVAYSLLHYVFEEGNLFDFLDRTMELLAPGGAALVGDVPNVSMRKRFFSSARGAAFHRQFTGRDEDPAVAFNRPEPGRLDDGALVGLMLRCRAAGCDAYLLPQSPELPMANRREDLLVCKP